jgi:hypothetical protein
MIVNSDFLKYLYGLKQSVNIHVRAGTTKVQQIGVDLICSRTMGQTDTSFA